MKKKQTKKISGYSVHVLLLWRKKENYIFCIDTCHILHFRVWNIKYIWKFRIQLICSQRMAQNINNTLIRNGCLEFSFFLPSLVYIWIYGWIKDCQMILFISTCKVYKVIPSSKTRIFIRTSCRKYESVWWSGRWWGGGGIFPYRPISLLLW